MNARERNGYDAAGNRTSKTAVQQVNSSPVAVTSNYSYDPINELTQAVVGGSLVESYSYDAVGNRLTSAGPTSYTYNSSNEITSTSAATYTYDGNGNTTSKTDSRGTTSYTWDFENRLASVALPGTGGTVNFRYDPFGKRIEKIAPTGTTVYAYDGDNITEELGGGSNLLAHYTQGAGIDEPLAMYQGLSTSYFHADGLGSIASLTDSTGNVAASYVYDSFGNLTASAGTITSPFQYTGREFDSESGLYYFRARYYDPTVGRFLSEDPSRFSGGINFYAYAGNSLINFADPSGLTPPDNNVQPWDLRPIVIQLLQDQNECKCWFDKGKHSAVDIMSHIPIDLYTGPIDEGGDTTENLGTPIEVNRRGPFYSTSPYNVGGPPGHPVYRSGSFGARMVILLHELAHKVMPPEFTPDALSTAASVKNTELVIQHCKAAIDRFQSLLGVLRVK
jgi:RHS repeat-associated protein